MFLRSNFFEHLIETYTLDIPMLKKDKTIAASLIEHGLLPSAPYHPNIAFSIYIVEFYCMTHLQCPCLAKQPFIKSLCGLHGIFFKLYFSKQFSIAYDLYLSIHKVAALHCNTSKWRLHHACPACIYKLEEENKMTFKMLVTINRNDSLKYIIH